MQISDGLILHSTSISSYLKVSDSEPMEIVSSIPLLARVHLSDFYST